MVNVRKMESPLKDNQSLPGLGYRTATEICFHCNRRLTWGGGKSLSCIQ